MRFTKKIAAAVMALALVFAVGTTCMAGNWDSYFGADQDWFEGASGKLTVDQPNAFTASLSAIGWGGVWGGQVKKTVSIKKGSENIISFTAQSTRVNKYIYVKISAGEELATSFWVYLPKGTNVKVSKKFKATNAATHLTFGIGGDFGDRIGSEQNYPNGDVDVRYNAFNRDFKGKGTYDTLLANDCDHDPTAVTEIKVSNLVLAGKPAKAKIKSAKGLKGKVKLTWKKVSGANGYQAKVGSKKKTTTKTKITIKAKKGKKVACKVRAYAGNKALYGAWSKAKKVKVK